VRRPHAAPQALSLPQLAGPVEYYRSHIMARFVGGFEVHVLPQDDTNMLKSFVLILNGRELFRFRGAPEHRVLHHVPELDLYVATQLWRALYTHHFNRCDESIKRPSGEKPGKHEVRAYRLLRNALDDLRMLELRLTQRIR
jgi:hypothetical protein